MQNSDTTKYVIRANINADGVVEKPDVVGAIFGQTEGLLGDDLDLRDLQKAGRVGRIEVRIESKSGKSTGMISIPSSLDKVETSILAASLETIDRIGPCSAKITVSKVEDVRASKRREVIDRAKEILTGKFDESIPESHEITESVKQAVRVGDITSYGEEKLPAGPNVLESDAILVVEGRADVLNLLRYGIKNTIAVEGTNIPLTIGELSKKKTVTAFVDGDRGGDLLLKELLQIADIDYVARAPHGQSVEDLGQKEVVKALRNKIPADQATEVSRRHKILRRNIGIKKRVKEEAPKKEAPQASDLKACATELSGTLSAKLLDKNKKVVKEVAVRDLAKTLKESNSNVKGVVFDGVITQRIMDIAAEKKLEYLVGVKLGNIVKKPQSVKILLAEEL
ncbi:MAG: DNA primase [Methanosarcinales archaeon]|nr:MAG: DNA primase [Methanosarcinales archaeon]